MTLIIAAVTPEYCVMGADRRLTEGGRVVEEESTKLTVLVTWDARTVVGYTGVARIQGFETDRWILDTLGSLRTQSDPIHTILEGMRSRASDAIRALAACGQEDLRLSLVVAGFIYQGGAVEGRIWKITNFEGCGSIPSRDHFEILTFVPKSPEEPLLVAAGMTQAVGKDEWEALESRFLKGIPAFGAERKLCQVIQRASLNPSAANAIGRQCNSCVVPRANSEKITAVYYSDSISRSVYAVNAVLRGDIWAGGLLQTGASSPPALVPKRRRNEPCSCGSDEKYKRCHGAMEFPFWPMFFEVDRTEPPIPPSGSKVMVLCLGSAGRS